MFIGVAFSFAAQTNFDRKIYKKQSRWKEDSTLLPQSKRVFDPKSFFVQLFHFIYLVREIEIFAYAMQFNGECA